MEEWRYRELYELEDRHWWFRSRRRVLWALLRRAGLPPSPRILDAGCGTGRNLVEFGGLGEAEGVDFSSDAVSFCRLRGLERVRQAPLEELPFESGRFDLALAADVIEHLDDDRRALAELRRVSAAGGRLVATVPAYAWLWSRHDESLHHKRRYTAARLGAALRAAGWEPEVATYFFSAVLPGVAAVRAFRRGQADGNGESDLSLTSAPVGRLLELPTIAEAKLIERGARLPAGVSLGVVARAVGAPVTAARSAA
jgi:SAM-dependent methyltransferase